MPKWEKYQKDLNKPRKPVKFKKPILPEGFILLRDTREQTPLFTRYKGLTVRVETLRHGDYAPAGFQDTFAIERKRASDFYSYIGSERKKTIDKLEALSKFEYAALVLESLNYDDLAYPYEYAPGEFSKVTPEMVRGFITALNIRYNVHFFAHQKRSVCEMFILDRAVRYFKMKRGI